MYADMAAEVITWLRSKTLVLSLLHLAVLRAVITRWTAHFVAFRRLLALKKDLLAVIYNDNTKAPNDKLIVIGDAKAKAKATKMINIIKNDTFWYAILW